MSLYYNPIFRKLGVVKTTPWGIAIRNANDNSILFNKNNRKEPPFTVVENTDDYWFADPLLFTSKLGTFLFVEAYSKERHKGELGVFDIINGCARNFRNIISTPTHMSYPFVFEYNNDYYMIPETGAAKEISLYKASVFPDKWDKICVLKSNVVYRDSTVYLDTDNSIKMITYRQEGSNRFNIKYYVELYGLDMGNFKLHLISSFRDKKKQQRPAGHVIKKDGVLYRLCQKCNRAYGESIIVYRMDNSVELSNDHKVSELRGQNIQLNNGEHAILLHTYSQAGSVEVIDYRCEK